jgi:beta-xylosidase
LNQQSGQEAYGDGSWASSIRFVNGTYYVNTFSYTTGRTHIYKTTNIEGGSWTTSVLNSVYHDSSLLFDSGRVFLVYGINDIRIIELTADASGILSGGLNQVLIPNASAIAGSSFIVQAEGSHIQKINGMYYVSLICWPSGGMRTQLVYRASTLTGSYQGRVALQNQGVAQGGFIDTPSGSWYAFLFRDSGAVGRIPYLVPVSWQDNWPVLGTNGAVPQNLGFNVEDKNLSIVTSDEFSQSGLLRQWQWNHNPLASSWSLLTRPGYFRISTSRLDSNLPAARNTLTQRTFGPTSVATVAMEMGGMRDGDYAGLGALQQNYGFVGVTKSGSSRFVVMRNGAQEISRVSVSQDRIYLRVTMDFRNQADDARFYYSLDGNNWVAIGNVLQMSYTIPHFMGYRFALFNYATQSAGGYADFDYFRVSE